jgi:hypothetical protein
MNPFVLLALAAGAPVAESPRPEPRPEPPRPPEPPDDWPAPVLDEWDEDDGGMPPRPRPRPPERHRAGTPRTAEDHRRFEAAQAKRARKAARRLAEVRRG